MRKTNRVWILAVAGCALVALPDITLAAPQQQQQQSQSVAEAARKAKEQQKNAPKAPTVWTNDTVGNVRGTVNVLGQPSAAPSATGTTTESKAGTAGAATAAAAPPASAEDLAKLQSQLTDAKKDLASTKTDLDIAQRKYNLDAAQYYGTPDYASNQQGQRMLDGEKATIASKKQAADAAQKKVDDLESQIKALGGKTESAPTKPTSPQS